MSAQWGEEEQAWIILSDLFLDTDVAELVPSIVARLSGLSFDSVSLEHMLIDDLCPVCLPNLRSVAGVWQGFNPDDLVRAVRLKRARQSLFRGVRRWWHQRQVARLLPEWAKVRAALD